MTQYKKASDQLRKRKIFYLFRHGETNWNQMQKLTGHIDDESVIITEKGYNQIKDISNSLLTCGIEAVFSSDLLRARKTAEIVNDALGVPIHYCSELRVLNLGVFQGQSREVFLQNEGVKAALLDHSLPIPGGESIDQLNERLYGFLLRIIQDYSYKSIAIITHGISIGNLIQFLLKTPYKHYDYAIIEYDDSFAIKRMGTY